MGLKENTVKGAFWVFADQFGSQIIGFIINIILARVLMPSDFGVIALYGVVMAVAGIIINGGFSSSIIRSKELTEEDLSTVFWFNIAAGLVIYLIVYLIAPVVSGFYHIPLLTPLIRVYGIILIIDSFVSVQVSLVTKEMNFKRAFKIQFPSMIIGGATGVFFALNGYGPWSLVFSSLVQNSVYTLQYWFYSDWRPKLIFSMEKFKYHFSFGVKMTFSALINTLFNNIYTIIIGKIFSTSQLAYFNRADALKHIPVANTAGVLNKITFPLFSKLSHDDQELSKYYKNILLIVIFVLAPMMGLMIVLAEPLFRFLLTEKWLPAVPYFQILCIAGLLYPIQVYNLNILQAKGKSDLYLKLELFKKAVLVLIVIGSLRFGMIGLVWGSVVFEFFSLYINTYYTSKLLHYPLINQFLDLLPSVLKAILIGGILWYINDFFFYQLNDITRLIIVSLLYIGGYLGISLLQKSQEIIRLKDLFNKNKNIIN
ncbi:Lipopolysaccharide biosynthesis protein WzxC [Elizabethkingia miricola]|nr:Lipopolysaccharide biosynthesis protein WzxC [Elizabethkingia miricola]